MRRLPPLILVSLFFLWPVSPAGAQPVFCSQAVVLTMPGVVWADVQRVRPPNLLAAVEAGAMGSLSVRTIEETTSYESGFTTIGAGARAEGIDSSIEVEAQAEPFERVRINAIEEMRALAEEARYDAVPGALAGTLEGNGYRVAAVGNGGPLDPSETGRASDGRWTLYAAMDPTGEADPSATGPGLLTADPSAPLGARTNKTRLADVIDAALNAACSVAIVEHGDLARADRAGTASQRASALLAADDLLGDLMTALDPEQDLLLIVSPTSPSYDDDQHLGIAVAVGPGYPGGSELTSPSTGRVHLVTLPDIAPTVLSHLDLPAPESMVGRPWTADEPETRESSRARIEAAVSLDDESVFAAGFQTPVVVGYIVLQVLVYAVVVVALRRGVGPEGRLLQAALLGIVAWPAATYLAGPVHAAALGTGGFALVLAGLTGLIVAAAWFASKEPLGRLLAVSLFTFVLLGVDLALGGPLQLNTVLGNYVLHGGRFAGLGNNGFSVLGSSAIIAGALLVQGRRDRSTFAVVGGLFAATVLIDGLPGLGSDVGGVLALVPALLVTYLLLAERRPGLKSVAFAVVAAVAFLVLFAVVDLVRPEEDRTHLGRLVEDVRERGLSPLTDAIGRKIETNLNVFRQTFFTYLVPPVVAAVAVALLRNGTLARYRPEVRSGLIGLLVLAILGFATNDSGIVIPSLILSFLVPTALLARLSAQAAPP